LVTSSSDDKQDESGICKQKLPYFPDDHKIKEDWMHPKNISGKDKVMLSSIGIYGVNPQKVEWDNDIITRVNTELPGGDHAARECFKNLTGRYPVGIRDDSNKDGTIIYYRALSQSESGHPKVEINGKNTTKVFEKITFK
jgi:hypothetical protein